MIWSPDVQTSNHRCRSRQIFGGAKDFFLNFPKLARNIFGPLLVRSFIQEDLQLGWPPKKEKVFMWFCKRWAPFPSNQTHVVRHFCPDFQVFTDLQSLSQILPIVTRILQRFCRIFTKSKLLGVRLHPLHPRFLHHCIELFSDFK